MSKRRLSVEGILFDGAGRVLLIKQGRKRHDWEFPGGGVKKREFVLDALIREVREETGLHVEPQRLVGIYHIPSESYCDMVFLCRPAPGRRTRDPRPAVPEIAACAFFPLNKLPKNILPFTRQCIADALGGVVQPLPVLLQSEDWLG